VLQVHEAAVLNPAFLAPLPLGNIRIAIDAIINDLTPLLGTNLSDFLVHVSSPYKMVSAVS
jgi:hypothetical protein